MIQHCFYLNLDRRPDRKEHIERELDRSELLRPIYQRFRAVDGSTIHPRDVTPGMLSDNAIDDILSETATSWGLSVTQGGLGVILSYWVLFDHISKLNGPAITLEDDSALDPNFDACLTAILSELPADFDLCYLGHGDIPVELQDYSTHLAIPKGRVVCLPGLIVSPAGAKKLLELFRDLDHQIDTAIAMQFSKLNVFVAKNHIVHIRNRLGSDIQGNANCRKQYQRQNYVFTTLAIGDTAVKNAAMLSRDLKYFDQKLLVVTDQPEAFWSLTNVATVAYYPERFSYNDKIICLQEGLILADAAVYIDADCRVLYRSFKNTSSEFSLKIAPGFHPSWDWGLITRPGNKFFQSEDVGGRVKGYGELALQLCKDLDIEYTKAFHYQEGIIVVSKEGGKEETFLETWKQLAMELDDYERNRHSHRIGVGEGNLIGLAVVKSGMTVNSHEVCNLFGNSIKYNFYGDNRDKQLRLAPDRKMVASTGGIELSTLKTSTKFKDRRVSLEVTVSEFDETTNMIVFKWNQNNAVEFLDHEFKVNGEVFHFQSEQTGEFYFRKTDKLEVHHTYDWYGEREWVKLI